ncbi:MFS transporter [Flavimaricola marinus]|uniref:Major Facilitator Superfamily protein n=1 Tax=Flavimaricola marinus TaxID=1819565 RepID=A0A238LG98_9RHOB|nr:MFS transporter [Flavimaricola marinus]SMY08593.1 Major Facilitator Superfamily protein [Flavimaricola marinus]
MNGSSARNIPLYRWSRFLRNLTFWQAVWFLYFQNSLSAAEAILLYAIYDIGTTVLEVPSGYMSDRLGRRRTLLASAVAGLGGALLLALGNSFMAFAAGQILLGASMAFASGTDEALLYESLAADGRGQEIERQELIAWRWSFSGLALSAVLGGAMTLWGATLPFFAAAVAYAALLGVTFAFDEPPKVRPEGAEVIRLGTLRAALTNPVLVWLFVVGVLMYVFSHLPFIFGQPFILQALDRAGLASEAPLVSGAVSTVMMLISLAASLVALRLRQRVGLAAILLLAFGMQIGLAGVLALTNSALAIGFLFLRMVPDALSRPFIIGRIQPLLSDDSRATYLSVKSLAGRLLFAGTLGLSALSTSDVGLMPYADIQRILGWYVLAGCLCLGTLWLAARRIGVEPVGEPQAQDPRVGG